MKSPLYYKEIHTVYIIDNTTTSVPFLSSSINMEHLLVFNIVLNSKLVHFQIGNCHTMYTTYCQISLIPNNVHQFLPTAKTLSKI